MLGTITGVAVVVFGVAAAALPPIVPAAAFAIGMWWWTIGKMWAETGVLAQRFGWMTMALAVAAFGAVALYAATGALVALADIPFRWTLGVWLIALAAMLTRLASPAA